MLLKNCNDVCCTCVITFRAIGSDIACAQQLNPLKGRDVNSSGYTLPSRSHLHF